MREASRLAQAFVAVCICASILHGQDGAVPATARRKADPSTDSFLTELQRIVNLAWRLAVGELPCGRLEAQRRWKPCSILARSFSTRQE